MQPGISIIILGSKNIERLEFTFESLALIQENEPLDILYVDQESKPSFLNFAKSYGARLLKIKGGDPPLGLVLNKSLALAKGETLFFLEGGVALHSQFFDEALPLMRKKNVFLVRGVTRELYPARSCFLSFIDSWAVRHPKDILEALSQEALLKKSTILELKGFNPRLDKAAFMDFYFRAKERYEEEVIEEEMELKSLDIEGFFDYLRYYWNKGSLFAELMILQSKKAKNLFLLEKVRSLKLTAIFSLLFFVFIFFVYFNFSFVFWALLGLTIMLFFATEFYLENKGTDLKNPITQFFFLFLSFFKQIPYLFGFIYKYIKYKSYDKLNKFTGSK